MKRTAFSIAFTLVAFASFCVNSFAAERVVVVGDSITGHSMNLPYGFTHEIRAALKEAGSDVEFTPLGGSGQTIFSWRNIIANSYEKNQQLDIPGIRVKEEFDKGADVLLVHLGMNDALQPSIQTTEEGFASWKTEYIALISDLRKRVPNVERIIISPPTMLTENPYAFKNELMDRFGVIVAEVATETGCEFLDVRSEFKRFFMNARLAKSDLRFTLDFVHPNQYGHQIMSWSFMKGLGWDEIAAKYYETKVAPELRDFDSPGLALFVVDGRPALDSKKNVATIRGTIRGGSASDVNISTQEGVSVESITELEQSGEFSFVVSGASSAFPTEVVVKFGDVSRSVLVNAPYYVATGFPFEAYPRPEDFPRAKAVTEIDKAVLAGKDPLQETFAAPNGEGDLIWKVYYPTADKTGAANPNAVDVADLTPANAFDAAYVVRYVVSPKAQKATLKLNSEGFSTTAIETIYLNGKEIYFGCLSPRHIKAEDSVEVELKEGVNILVARVDHTYWQWAASFSFEGAEDLSF